MLVKIFLLLTFLALTHGSVELGLRKNDPSEVVSWKIGSFIFPNKNSTLHFELKFFSLDQPGNYPVVFFLTGLNGFAPNFFYTDFCQNFVLKTNTILVVLDGLQTSKLPEKEEVLFEATFNWTTQNLMAIFRSDDAPSVIRNKVFPDLNTTGVTLLSHSAAGHTVVSYLVKQCGPVDSLILLDPVDGYDPFGLVKDFITHPPTMLNFAIPTLILSTGLSRQSVNPAFPACAPDLLSNTRFYEVMSGPTWKLNFTDYGHADILTDTGRFFADLICKPCKENCQIVSYKDNTINAISYFLKALRVRDSTFVKAIENPSTPYFDPTIRITPQFQLNGYDVTRTGGFCRRV